MQRNQGGRPRHPDILTPAEQRVLDELRKGGTNAEIAVRLGVSPDAVKYHVGNMLGKLHLANRHELAAWRPRAERRRRGLLAAPLGLALLARPLAWVAVGAALTAGVVAVTVVLSVALDRGGGEIVPAATPLAATEITPATPATTPTAPPTPVAASTPAPLPPAFNERGTGFRRIEGLYTPRLLVVTDGAPDSLILDWSLPEWYHDGEAVDGWHYRQRPWGSDEEWGPWTDIPGSKGVTCLSDGSEMTTCSYRVTGLLPDAYEFAVRHGVDGLSATGVGATPHKIRLAILNYPPSLALPSFAGAALGDGRTVWVIGPALHIVIPEGMRLRHESPICIDCGEQYVLVDVETGSRLEFRSSFGAFRASNNIFPSDREYHSTVLPDRTGGRDVTVLFGQIIASVVPPLPSTCRCILGDFPLSELASFSCTRP